MNDEEWAERTTCRAIGSGLVPRWLQSSSNNGERGRPSSQIGCLASNIEIPELWWVCCADSVCCLLLLRVLLLLLLLSGVVAHPPPAALGTCILSHVVSTRRSAPVAAPSAYLADSCRNLTGRFGRMGGATPSAMFSLFSGLMVHGPLLGIGWSVSLGRARASVWSRRSHIINRSRVLININ